MGMTIWNGLEVEYEIIKGDWGGDPDVPGGVHIFPDYVEYAIIYTPDGTDITDCLNDKTYQEICDYCLGGQ